MQRPCLTAISRSGEISRRTTTLCFTRTAIFVPVLTAPALQTSWHSHLPLSFAAHLPREARLHVSIQDSQVLPRCRVSCDERSVQETAAMRLQAFEAEDSDYGGFIVSSVRTGRSFSHTSEKTIQYSSYSLHCKRHWLACQRRTRRTLWEQMTVQSRQSESRRSWQQSVPFCGHIIC